MSLIYLEAIAYAIDPEYAIEKIYKAKPRVLKIKQCVMECHGCNVSKRPSVNCIQFSPTQRYNCVSEDLFTLKSSICAFLLYLHSFTNILVWKYFWYNFYHYKFNQKDYPTPSPFKRADRDHLQRVQTYGKLLWFCLQSCKYVGEYRNIHAHVIDMLGWLNILFLLSV